MLSRARLLVVALDDVPRRLGDVGVHQHLVLGAGVVLPAGDRLQVHRGQLPPPHRVVEPGLEPALLLVVADREPVLAQQDAVLDEHPLEDRALVQEPAVLAPGCRSPSPSRRRRGCTRSGRTARSRRRPAGARRSAGSTTGVRSRSVGAGSAAIRATRGLRYCGDPLDRAALAGGVPALEDHDDAPALGPDPLLHLHELGLQPEQLRLVDRRRQLPAARGFSLMLRG